MKVLFIDPPRIVKKNVRASKVKEPDLGIGYVCAAAGRDGHDTTVFDASAEGAGMDAVRDRISAARPDIVAMPLFTFKAREAGLIASMTKELNPAAKVVVGGAHATAIPVETLEEFSSFDFAVMGEGEEVFCETARAIESGREDFSEISGLCWRKDNKIIKNAQRPSIASLDDLAFPDWGAFPLNLYVPLYSTGRNMLELPISSARGCPGRCFFCFRLTRGFIRSRSAGNVVDEMERDIRDFGAESVIFMDESFTAEPERTHLLCDEITRRGLHKKISWLCETRVDCADETLLRKMKAAGCAHVSFGVESGSGEILEKNRKNTTAEAALNAIRIAKKAGLQTDAYFIFGLPYDTRETMMETRRFSLKANPDYANYFILVPYPGTMAMKLAREGKANLKLLSTDWSEYGIQIGGALELQDVSRSELERFQFASYLMFYLRPSRWKSLIRIVSFKALPVYIWNILKGMASGKRGR